MMDWKREILPASIAAELPGDYVVHEGIVGRADLLGPATGALWSDSQFVARSNTAHTTSAVEAKIRGRHVERLADEFGLDRTAPVLDLGCADGALARNLLDLGFQKVVSTDILPSGVASLQRSLEASDRERVLLLVDDMLRAPFPRASFGTVIAWGILSVTGDFDRALALAWDWIRPGGYLLLAEPLLEQALVYALVRGDVDEFRRIYTERTRAAMWDKRDDRYPVNPASFYGSRLSALRDARVLRTGGISMLPSLALGGVAEHLGLPAAERAALATLLDDAALDELSVWRQGYWFLQKT
jgi:SAM-dependent methyltransferase